MMFGPNISGTFATAKLQSGGDEYLNGSGAFKRIATSQVESCDGAQWSGVSWNFDASRVDAVFGDSSTVQPEALQLLPCIKT